MPPATAASAPAEDRRGTSPARKRPGDGEVVRRRVEDVLEHRDEHLGEQPAEQRRRATSAAASTSAASLQRKAPTLAQRGAERGHRRELVPALGRARARRTAPSRRRRATSANASSIRLIPRQVDGRDRADRLRGLLADVLDDRPVGARWRRRRARARAAGSSAALAKTTFGPPAWSAACEVGEVGDHERVPRRRRELLHDPDDVEGHDAEAAACVVEDAQPQQVADAAASSR